MGPEKPGDALSYAEAKDLADTVIEIIVVNAKAGTTGSKDLRIGLGMVAQVRVLSIRDGKELDSFTITGGGGLRTLDEWLSALREGALPMLNVGYADKDGHVAYLYNARLPLRPQGYDWTKPVAGHTSRTLWTEYLPFDALPLVRGIRA